MSPCQRCTSRKLACTYSRLRGDTRPEGLRSPKYGARTGAKSLLAATDPKQANMWRSIGDNDDPGTSRGSEIAPALSLESFTQGEDERSFQSMDSLIFDLLPADMDEAPVASSSDIHYWDPYIPVFRSELRGMLKEKTAYAVQELEDLHHILISSDVSYDAAFDKPTAEDALSPDSVVRFAAVYFYGYHHVPIVNRHSFGLHDTTTTLLLAASLVGALRSPPQDNVLSLVTLARLIEEYVFLQLAKAMSKMSQTAPSSISVDVLETLEAAVLVNNVQLLANSAVSRARLRMRLLPTLVSAVRRFGLFAVRHSTYVDEMQYVHEEGCIR